MKVLFLPEVEDYFFELIEILFEKEYFGFKETAIEYVVELENDITQNLANKVKRIAPPYFDKYGQKLLYAVFEKNKETSWYVFFNVYQDENHQIILLVRYITNNHVIAKYM